MKTKIHRLIVTFVIVIVFSCGSRARKGDTVVAKVGDKCLYLSEMLNVFPKECTKEDSLTLAKLYIDNWIKTRLLLKKAELNLSVEELNISEEIEKYRTDLLIYKYEDRMLQEKLDTTVFDSEIKRFYETNIANFSSDDYVVRAVYIKLSADAPAIWNVRRWMASVNEDDIQNLTDYCRRYAAKYNFFDDEWVLWSNIEMELPYKDAATRTMKQNDRIEQQDGRFIYLVHIREKRAPGDAAPLAFVKNKVKSIIINKRKVKFISELERNIYNDGLAKKQFEIFEIK